MREVAPEVGVGCECDAHDQAMAEELRGDERIAKQACSL